MVIELLGFIMFGTGPPKVQAYSAMKQMSNKLKDPQLPKIGRADGVYANGTVAFTG